MTDLETRANKDGYTLVLKHFSKYRKVLFIFYISSSSWDKTLHIGSSQPDVKLTKDNKLGDRYD